MSGCLDRGECAWVPRDEWCKWCQDHRDEMIRKAQSMTTRKSGGRRKAPGIGKNRTFSPHMRVRAGFAIAEANHSTELRQNRAYQKAMAYFPIPKKERS